MKNISIKNYQQYIKNKDFRPEIKNDYFIKLTEEVGELAKALLRDKNCKSEDGFKGSIEEELCDILYYTLAIANVYDVDLEKWIPLKEKLNDKKYGTTCAEAFFE